jgi:hypothetical protein
MARPSIFLSSMAQFHFIARTALTPKRAVAAYEHQKSFAPSDYGFGELTS